MAIVTVQSGSLPYQQTITGGGHTWSADEPRDLGGQDQGPTPYHLLLSALGTCTSITLQMYAARKGWSLEAVEVVLEHHRVHARDCRDCQTRDGLISEIDIELKLRGDLSAEQRDRLLEIAGKCPVKKTLAGEVKIHSRLA